MARVKVINRRQNQDLIGGNFVNTASETVFSLGRFSVESNFTGRRTRNYGNEISSFSKPITLDSLALTSSESKTIAQKTTTVELNLDRSDLTNFARFGSAAEIMRVSIRNIIQKYPASLYADTQVDIGGNITFDSFSYDNLTNTSFFRIPIQFITNDFELIFRKENTEISQDNVLKNLNISFEKYVIWRDDFPEDNTHGIIGFTGSTQSVPYLRIKCIGNPFTGVTSTTGSIDFHLKPKLVEYNKFYTNLNEIERYLLSNRRTDFSGFDIELKVPIINGSGAVDFNKQIYTWNTTDGYNLDITGGRFNNLINGLSNLGATYDDVKSDLIARLLTPSSLELYDNTDEKKMQKLLKIYGREFDEIKRFIDSLVFINKTSYDKKDNIPDVLVKNLAATFGWDVFNLVQESELVEAFFSNEVENSQNDLLPAEIDIELWRRIVINTNYYWKSKGTRHAIKSMFRLIGIPEPFINITEYVYTVDGRINPNEVDLTLDDLPSATLPYDQEGYPIAPQQNNDFFFQLSGDSDSGQAYINLYRSLGFKVNRVVDNKKAWTEQGFTERIHPTTPNYFQQNSRLLINTKEVDVTLDIARAIEYDVYCYNKEIDDPITSSAVTKPYLYVNIPFDYGVSANTFTLPELPLSGSDIQVNFNGITLTSGNTGNGDYVRVSPTAVTLNEGAAETHTNGQKDVITLTYLHDRLGSAQFTQVTYVVTAPTINGSGTELDLGIEPDGDIQLVLNGMSLTKGTSLFTGDFIINPNDRTKVIIQNTELQQYLQFNPVVRVWYIKDEGESTVEKKSEAHRVDSFTTSKLFFDPPNYIYTMDYTAFDAESIKVTVNGITLQSGRDFTLNPSNKRQISFRVGVPINLGDIIGVYYVIGEGETPPLLPPDPTFPSIQDMSFLEYLELIQRRLINVRNRKTISNFNGGYYPTVLQLYEEYIRRSKLDSDDPLLSNGYTFDNLYPFINQYNSFFTRFVNQLLPLTIIQKKSGILIRNTSFTRQKFMYRRGVNFDNNILYNGDDGAEYKKILPKGELFWSLDDVVCANPSGTTTTTSTTTTTTTTLPPTTTSGITTTSGTTTTLPPETTVFEFYGSNETSVFEEWFVDYTVELVGGSNQTINVQTDFPANSVGFNSKTEELNISGGNVTVNVGRTSGVNNLQSITYLKNNIPIFSEPEKNDTNFTFTFFNINAGDELSIQLVIEENV